MDRYYLENPEKVHPDEDSDNLKLIASTGMKHEKNVLDEFRSGAIPTYEVPRENWLHTQELTIQALDAKAPIIFQATLSAGSFAGFAELLLNCRVIECRKKLLLLMRVFHSLHESKKLQVLVKVRINFHFRIGLLG